MNKSNCWKLTHEFYCQKVRNIAKDTTVRQCTMYVYDQLKNVLKDLAFNRSKYKASA